MNTSSPNTVRVTPAFYLALATILVAIVTVWSYIVDMPFVYIVALPATVGLMLLTGDVASKYRR